MRRDRVVAPGRRSPGGSPASGTPSPGSRAPRGTAPDPSPVITPGAASLSSRACTVPRATPSRRRRLEDAEPRARWRRARSICRRARPCGASGCADCPAIRRTVAHLAADWAGWRSMTDSRHPLDRWRPDRGRAQGRPDPRAAAPARRPRGVRRRARDPFPVTGMGRDRASSSATPRRPRTTTSSAWGMDLVAYSGPENGNRDHKSYVLQVRLDPVRPQRRGVAPTAPLVAHHAPPRRRRRRHRPRGARRRPVHRPGRRGRAPRCCRRAARRHRRARHGADRRDRDLRRDPPHARRPRRQTYAGPYLPGYVAVEPRWDTKARPARSASSRPSTTSSATSSSARWTSGSSSTTRSWASRTWPSSSATTSPPSTPR